MLNPTELKRERAEFIDEINKDGKNGAIESSRGFKAWKPWY